MRRKNNYVMRRLDTLKKVTLQRVPRSQLGGNEVEVFSVVYKNS